MLNVGIIGCGYWGPNLIRNFNENPSSKVSYICDINRQRLKGIASRHPSIASLTDHRKMLKDDNLQLVVIATPVSTHYKLAHDALSAGKHVLIEKPMTTKVSDALKLIELSEKRGLKVFVDHTFIFTEHVRKIKELISSGEIGDIYYFDSVRINLGLLQHDVNVIWDLAPHDFSIMDYLIEERPISLSAIGSNRVHHRFEDIAYVAVRFQSGLIAHFHVNWLSPVKIRKIIIGGSKNMLVYDDLVPDTKVRIYDRGVNLQRLPKDRLHQSIAQYRIGNMYAPHIDNTEALKTEVAHIVDCIANDKKPIADGYAGLNVVRLLEVAERSLAKNSAFIRL